MKIRTNLLKIAGVAGVISFICGTFVLLIMYQMIGRMASFQSYDGMFVLWMGSIVLYIVSSLVFIYGFYELAKRAGSRYLKTVSILKMVFFIVFVVVLFFFLIKFDVESFKKVLSLLVGFGFAVNVLFGSGLIYLSNKLNFGLVAGIFEISKVVGIITRDSLTFYVILCVLAGIFEIALLFSNSKSLKN